MKKIIKFLIVPLLIFLFLRIVFLTGFWENLEQKARDVLFLLRGDREISDDIIIIEIGDETFNTLAKRWPLPRSYHAKLIENLQKAGVKQIIFDIEFTEYSEPKEDLVLRNTLKKYDNVILAGKMVEDKHNNAVIKQFLPPIKSLRNDKIKWGLVNISTDSDGFVRRYELFQKKKSEIHLSLGAMALEKHYEQLHKNEFGKPLQIKKVEDHPRKFMICDNCIPKVDWNETLINYYGPAGTFQMIDYSDIIDDSTFVTAFEKELEADIDQYYKFKEKLKNKTVFIGITALEFHDAHHTPFFTLSNKLTSGVEIHATFLEMAKRQDYLYEFNYFYFIMIFLGLSFLLFALAVNIKPTYCFFLNIFLILSYLILCFYSFKENSLILPLLEIPVLIILIYFVGLIFQYIKTTQERKFIKNAFRHFIAPELVNELLSDPSKLEYGGEQKEISILFADIVSFTPYTESHTPKQTVDILREYLTEMVTVITKNKGTVDKFVGDKIVALFGAPLEMEDHAYYSCKAALEMREKIAELQDKWQQENKDPFDMGIGINSGDVTVGNLGSDQIFDYTAIGDNMNAGSRLETLTREFATQNNIIISEATKKFAKDKIICNFIAETRIKGKNQSINIYELIGIKKQIAPEPASAID